MAAEARSSMPPRVEPIELPPAPPHEGSIVELSFGKLAAALMWLFEAVAMLVKGIARINEHLIAFEELWKRLEKLENAPPPEVQTIVQEVARPKTPPPPPPPQIEIPHIPTEEEIAEIARKVAKAMLDANESSLLEKIQAVDDKIPGLGERIKTLEDIEANRKDPFERMQKYFQEIGFLHYEMEPENDPLKLLGQVFVLLRQDISMCPKIKDLEDAENALKARINQVESEAAADREARSQAAAAESAKIREDLTHLEGVVQGLVDKNLKDGDVAGRLRDLTTRVDVLEERRIPNLERRVKALEDKEDPEPEEVVVEDPKKKGFLETLAEVDIQEEVRRLRAMVEAMQAAMPYETRQTLEFLKNNGNQKTSGGLGATTTSAGGLGATQASVMSSATQQLGGSPSPISRDDEIDLVNFRTETENQLERYTKLQEKQQQNMIRNLKNHERKVESLEAKILDLWGRLPKVLALLEPLQVQMEQTMNAETDGSTGGGPGGAPAPPMDGGTGGKVPDAGATAGRPSPTFAETKQTSEPTVNRSQLGGTLGAGKGADIKPNLGGFSPLGPGSVPPSKDKGASFSPLAEMGSLTNLIKIALQSTTNDIHAELRQDLLRLRTEMMGGLDGKANKSELAALASRIDAWTQKSRTRDRFTDTQATRFTDSSFRDRSLSPRAEMADARMGDRQNSAPPGKPPGGAASPSLLDRKKGATCHDNCKTPTCPRALQMSQSLSRLPALKTVQ